MFLKACWIQKLVYASSFSSLLEISDLNMVMFLISIQQLQVYMLAGVLTLQYLFEC